MKELTPKQTNIMATWTRISLADTDHIAALHFSANGSPSKRASEALKELELMGLVEGARRSIDKTKVWRLARKGRARIANAMKSEQLHGLKVSHHLAITSCYAALEKSGHLTRFTPELREPFGTKVYAPDAFFVFDKRPYLLEIQLTPLSIKRWAEKWAIGAEYFDGFHHQKASFQHWPGRIIRPQIAVITRQPPDNVMAGSRLPLHIYASIEDFIHTSQK